MLACVQFPLADMRCLVAEDTGRLSRPSWPRPAYGDFIRSAGAVRPRRRGGPEDWTGETRYCDARGVLRFRTFTGEPPRGALGGPVVEPIFRRFFASGNAIQWPGTVARLEIGFKVPLQISGNGNVKSRSLPDPKKAALSCLTFPVAISPDSGKWDELMVTGKAIARRVRLLTTSLRKELSVYQDWWVTPGSPLVLLEATQGEGDFEDRALRSVISSSLMQNEPMPIAAHHFDHIARRGQWVPIWALFVDKNADRVQLRNLRIHLARLHNEREVLGLVLRKCQESELDPEYGPVADYLARQSERLNRFRSEGFPQSPLMEFAHQVDWSVNRDDWSDLIEILHSISPGLSSSVARAAGHPKPKETGGEISIGEGSIVYLENGAALIMRDGDKIGAKFGDNAQVSHSNFQGEGEQIVVQSSVQELLSGNQEALAQELRNLREKLKSDAQNSEEDRAVLEIGQARESLMKGDHQGTLSHLRAAGNWALNVATSIGAQLAAAAIKAALGM